MTLDLRGLRSVPLQTAPDLAKRSMRAIGRGGLIAGRATGKGSLVAGLATGHVLYRFRVELVPFLVAHALLVLVWMHHASAPRDDAAKIYMIPALGCAAICYLAFKRAGDSGKMAGLASGALSALLMWAAWTVYTGVGWDQYFVLLLLATAAGIPYWIWLAERRNPRHVEVTLPGNLVPDLQAPPEDPFKPVGLAGASWHGARENTASGYRAVLNLPAGTNGRKVADSKGPDLAHLLDVGVDDVELLEDLHRASRVDVLVHLRDLLEQPRQWPLLDQERIDLYSPLPIGLNRAGELVNLDLNERHLLIGGVSGSGKSNVLSMIVAGAALDPDVALFGIDGKVTELPLFRERMSGYVDDDPQMALAMLSDLRRTMASRQRLLRADRRRCVTRADGMGRIVLAIDELARFLLDADTDTVKAFRNSLLDLQQVGRSVGLSIVGTTQRPSAQMLDGGDLRAGFTYRMAMKTTDAEGSRMILGHSRVNAATIDKDMRGGAYLESSELRPRLIRSFLVPDPDLVVLADRAKQIDPPQLPGVHVSDLVRDYDPDERFELELEAVATPAALAAVPTPIRVVERTNTQRSFPDGKPLQTQHALLWDKLAGFPDGAAVADLQLAGVGYKSRTAIMDQLKVWTAAGYLERLEGSPQRFRRYDLESAA